MSQPIDLKVHKRDKDGQVISAQPYRLHCVGRAQYFELPKGSKIYHTQNGVELSAEEVAKAGLPMSEKQARELAARSKPAALAARTKE